MANEFTIEQAVDFSIMNEADTLNEEKFKGDVHCESIRRFLDMISYYADSYGFTVEEFKAEALRQKLY